MSDDRRAYIDRKADAPTEWSTPLGFYSRLSAVFGPFNLDPASNCGAHGELANYVTQPYYCLGCGQDGLEEPWYGKVYVNPPFDRSLPMWVEKAELQFHSMHKDTNLVAMLLPVRTGRKWWQNMRPNHIIWLPGRLRFGGADNSAPFDCAMVLWWQL